MIDYFAILSKAINIAQSTSAQARAETYGIARAALRKELTLAGLDLTGDKAKQELAALERAILRRDERGLHARGERRDCKQDCYRQEPLRHWVLPM